MLSALIKGQIYRALAYFKDKLGHGRVRVDKIKAIIIVGLVEFLLHAKIVIAFRTRLQYVVSANQTSTLPRSTERN